jgi:hypothetical protein
VKRARIAWGASLLLLATGIATAALSAENRARGNELDRLERWCEAQARRNELAHLANERAEWELLGAGLPRLLVAREAGP